MVEETETNRVSCVVLLLDGNSEQVARRAKEKGISFIWSNSEINETQLNTKW